MDMNTRFRGFSSLVLILALTGLVVVVGGYFLTKKVQTADTHYVDSTYGFSITLPDGFAVDRIIDGSAYNVIFNDVLFRSEEKHIEVSISKEETELSNEQFMSSAQEGATSVSDTKEVLVDGLQGLQRFEDFSQVTQTEQGCRWITYFMKDAVSHRITYVSNDCDALRNDKSVYEAMVASYRGG